MQSFMTQVYVNGVCVIKCAFNSLVSTTELQAKLNCPEVSLIL